MLARSLRHVLLAVEPQVLALGQRGVALAHQALVLALSDLVYRLEYMAHDVEAIKHHLVIGLRHLGPASIDVGRPHIQTDRLDLLAACLWESLEVGRQLASRRSSPMYSTVAACNHTPGSCNDAPWQWPSRPRPACWASRRPWPPGHAPPPAFHDCQASSQVMRRISPARFTLVARKTVDSQRFEQIRKSTPSFRPRQRTCLTPCCGHDTRGGRACR